MSIPHFTQTEKSTDMNPIVTGLFNIQLNAIEPINDNIVNDIFAYQVNKNSLMIKIWLYKETDIQQLILNLLKVNIVDINIVDQYNNLVKNIKVNVTGYFHDYTIKDDYENTNKCQYIEFIFHNTMNSFT